MRPLLFFLISLMAGPLSAAEGCLDVWFTRNLIMDRAGHCFSSPLGQTLFDNADCKGQVGALSPQDQAIVNHIREVEARHGCQVNTNQTWADIPDINFRKVLTDLPIRDEFEWACIGWTAQAAALYAGRYGSARVLGHVQPGDYVNVEHYGLPHVEAWSYVLVFHPGGQALKSAGWLYWPGQMPCAQEAG